jgi:hypothetical protein
MTLTRLSRRTLGIASLVVGAVGLVAPGQLARLAGDDAAIARSLALRDAAIGIGLLRSDNVSPLIARAAADFEDALRLRHRSPLVAGIALASALVAVTTAMASTGR